MKASTVLTLAEIAGTALYCWWLYTEISKTENVEADFWYYLTKALQAVAAWFGRLGLVAELEYHKALAERTL